jgi:hypothetical protein
MGIVPLVFAASLLSTSSFITRSPVFFEKFAIDIRIVSTSHVVALMGPILLMASYALGSKLQTRSGLVALLHDSSCAYTDTWINERL